MIFIWYYVNILHNEIKGEITLKKSILKKTIISTSIILTLSSMMVFAATLMTYSGTGIRGKYSVNSFTTSSTKTVYINHTNTAWNNVASSSKYMEVQVHKRNAIGIYSATGMQFNVSGVSSKTQSYSIAAGTYKLYFHAPVNPAAADISGSVTD